MTDLKPVVNIEPVMKLILILLAMFEVNPSFAQNGACPQGQHPDTSMGGMCMPDETQPTPALGQTTPELNRNLEFSFHLNQFFVAGETSGPRGRHEVYSPGMWMLDATKLLSNSNQLKAEFMGTTDKWLIPNRGYPELYQTGEANLAGRPYIDAQHPHSSPIMGLTFSDIISFADHRTLTFFAAPRGEATAGPDAFMHRPSAEGNPYAPLSHHLQDVFHITSTVFGTSYEDPIHKLEVSAFSGHEPSPEAVNLDIHRPDSFGFRYGRKISDVVRIGGAYARVYQDEGTPSHTDDPSLWLTTGSRLGEGSLNTESIWGMVHDELTSRNLNGFVEEFVYRLNRHHIFGRVEILQRTSDQLEIIGPTMSEQPQWIKAITLGYENRIFQKEMFELYLGGSYTQDISPTLFSDAYSAYPHGFEVHLRTSWMTGKM